MNMNTNADERARAAERALCARARLRAASAQPARGCSCAMPIISTMHITLQSSAMCRKMLKTEPATLGRKDARARPARARARGANGRVAPAAAR